MLYISTGCDFVSFFNGIGKATFMATLFEYSQFICDSTAQTPGMLSQPDADGFLSFIRLVGCAYFRKHKSVFLPSFPTPMSLFNSLLDSKQHAQVHHSAWLSLMREKIWLRIKYEEEMIPSYDALDRHWKRSCWVQCVWSQATSNNITYPVLDGNGWKQVDTSTLAIDWDSESNVSVIRDRVTLLQKGCGCKTGCQTNRCKCRRDKHDCGPGCKCQGCTNVPQTSQTSHELNLDQESSSESEDEFGDSEVDDIMRDVFGDNRDTDNESAEETEDMDLD